MSIALYMSGGSDLFGGGLGYRALADAMTLPAVILLGVGTLILASRSGVFDIFSYAFTRLVGILAPFSAWSNERFYEFKSRRRRAEFISGTVPLCVGALFLVFALIFLCLFYAS